MIPDEAGPLGTGAAGPTADGTAASEHEPQPAGAQAELGGHARAGT
jgi:hypothetical protein